MKFDGPGGALMITIILCESFRALTQSHYDEDFVLSSHVPKYFLEPYIISAFFSTV